MMQLSHTYVSTQVTGRKDPLLIVGSVIPDISSTSVGALSRSKLHDLPQEFNEFIRNNYPEAKDFGLGVLLHGFQSKGADYYTDDFETGFAYKYGATINEDVAKLIDVEPGKVSLTLSHNFIEFALDILLKQDHPKLIEDYKQAWDEVDEGLIQDIIAEYLSIEQTVVKDEITKFKRVLGWQNLTSKEKQVENIAVPLIKMRLDKEVKAEDVMSVTNSAIDVIEDYYQDFIESTIQDMKITFKDYL